MYYIFFLIFFWPSCENPLKQERGLCVYVCVCVCFLHMQKGPSNFHHPSSQSTPLWTNTFLVA
jgi:hypothetical protein